MNNQCKDNVRNIIPQKAEFILDYYEKHMLHNKYRKIRNYKNIIVIKNYQPQCIQNLRFCMQ